MQLTDLRASQLKEAPWNPNVMDEAMSVRLKESLTRYGLVMPLVVRLLSPSPEGAPDNHTYEVLGGNQRLKVLLELGHTHAPCVIVDLEDAPAKLLSQALNRIEGEDDLGRRAELLREVLKSLPQDQVLAVLPETAQSLQALTSLGTETIAGYLQNWQAAQTARLKHLQFQLTPTQLQVIEGTLAPFLPKARSEKEDSPNRRGTALYLLCRAYLEARGV